MNALRLHPKDNVATCVQAIGKGDPAIFQDGSVTTLEEIPACHKVALVDIPLGGMVVKYGEVIGKATSPIAKGSWVSDRNIVGMPRNYEEEFVRE